MKVSEAKLFSEFPDNLSNPGPVWKPKQSIIIKLQYANYLKPAIKLQCALEHQELKGDIL